VTAPEPRVQVTDPLAKVKAGDPSPRECIEGEWACEADGPAGFICSRDPDHPGQHIACGDEDDPVYAVWEARRA
jgi:hypothetical protein